MRELAVTLARIHAVPVGRLDPCPAPVVLWTPQSTAWLEPLDPGVARTAHEHAQTAQDSTARRPDAAQTVLSHGDYQHFNVLWQGERVSAVVDWPNVGLADRGIDVGHCQLNLAVLFSADAAMWFLEDDERAGGQSVGLEAQMLRLLNFGPAWPEFIPVQVAGRAPVDGPGMAERVHEAIARSLRRAG